MAHNIEPMDIDNIEGDFDNKENSYHHSNVLPRTPCTEKGYEELDVSELNMKLRYSITPASSPMSKSYTANSLDNKYSECPDNTSNSIENTMLTRSFNSTLTKNESLSKSIKLQPLQLHTAEQSLDNNRNALILRPLDSTITNDDKNITVTVTDAVDIDENLSLPSSLSSALHTPEATTPTKDIPKNDGGSPIMRGLKSVLNMFRASQSPIPLSGSEENLVKHDISSPIEAAADPIPSDLSQVASASTPIMSRNKQQPSSKRGSPLKESVVFNEDFEKELLWKDETTILFSEEKIPIHKLFFQQSKNVSLQTKEVEIVVTNPVADRSLNETVEYMDVSYNDSVVKNKTITDSNEASAIAESDSEFVDCETTFTQHSDDKKITEPDVEKTPTQITDVSASTEIPNELCQGVTSEDCNKNSSEVTKSDKTPTAEFNSIQQLPENTQIHDAVITDSKDPLTYSSIKDLTQRAVINIETGKDFLDVSTSLLTDVTPLPTTLTVSHEINTQLSEDIPSDVTITVEEEIKPLLSPAIENIEEKTGTEYIKPLDASVSIESYDKPMSVSTFIKNNTQNNTMFNTNSVNEPISVNTIDVKDNSLSAPTLVDGNVSLNVSKEDEDKPISSSTFVKYASDTVSSQLNDVSQLNKAYPCQSQNLLDLASSVSSNDTVPSSSTFIMNATQNVEACLASTKNMDELLDGTVTFDPMNKPPSSTFIKDITQDIDSHMSSDNIHSYVDTSKLLDSESKLKSSTFACDNSQSEDKLPSEVNDTTKSMQIPISLPFNEEMTQDNKVHILNSTVCNEGVEQVIISKSLDFSSSTMKTQQECDFQVANDYESCLNEPVGVNTAVELTKLDSDLRTHIDSQTEVQSEEIQADDIPKPSNAILPEALPEVKISSTLPAENTLKELSIQGHEKDISAKVELESSPATNPVMSNEISSEHYNIDKIQLTKQLVTEGSGDASKLQINKIEGRPSKIDFVDSQVEPLESIGCVEILPVNTPLPDEDEIESEPLPTVQLATINNSSNSIILPDVITNVEASKIQDANLIDEVPIDPDQLSTSKDLITEIVSIKVEDLNKENRPIAKTNDLYCKEIKEEAEILTDSTPISEHNKGETKCEVLINESKGLESKSEDELESMDISYNNHDISTCTDRAREDLLHVLHNITTVVNDPVNNSNATKEGLEIERCNQLQLTSLPDMNVSSKSDINMGIDIPPGLKDEQEKNTESLQTVPKSDKEILHEEIINSENNSPYVLISVDKDPNNKNDNSFEDDFEKIENPFTTKLKLTSPNSPPIASKGYNFNFDEIDDPFATKTKIRTSPPIDSPKQMPEEKPDIFKKTTVNKNKRKSCPVRPKPVITKNKFNKSFDNTFSTQCVTVEDKTKVVNKEQDLNVNVNMTKDDLETNEGTEHTESNVVEKFELENNVDADPIVNVDIRKEDFKQDISPLESTAPSSSDQSIYLSAATSSGESLVSKNVFNLPEIDDMNFNPFATKSKLSISPPLSLEIDESNKTQTKLDYQNISIHENANATLAVDTLHNLSQKINSVNEEKDSFDASNTTCSSKGDKNTTVREVHTDNDDTVEGPFLEANDNEIEGMDIEKVMKYNELAGLDLQNNMMEFSDLPAQDNEDNELFIDAAAYEFLLNQNKGNVVVDSGKESLFLKFDPLFAKRLSSEGIAAALSKIQKRQSTPKKMPKPTETSNTEKAVAGPSMSKISPQQLDTTDDISEDLNVTSSKPMMVVTPAVNPIIKPRKSTTPASSNRRSITFTSPAIAVIDRLLSLSANNSLVDSNTTITQVSREQDEAELALTQLRELLAEKEISVYNLRSESKELKDRLMTLESQMKVLETESEERLKKVNELNEKLTEKTQINKSMAAVVEEYERTIASLIAETEQDRKRHNEERERLIKERDEQTAHLASMEVSFSDLHSKYEKSKQIILSCKANEDTYKKSIKDFEENLSKMQNNYELLKQHATSKLNHANQELEKMNKAHESEVLKLNAMIKRKELHITSLEETLAQKTKANEELTAICDELINKVG